MLTHGNWIAAMENERDVLNLSPDDVYLGFYPMNHVGVSWGISTIRYGGTFVIMERYKLEAKVCYGLPNTRERSDRGYHIPIANAYGLSETIVVGTGSSTTPGSSMGYESVGLPVGFSEIKIVDEDGKSMKEDFCGG